MGCHMKDQTLRICLLLTIMLLPLQLNAQHQSRVTIKAILVDNDLNQKPVPRLAVDLTPEPASQSSPTQVKTGFDGTIVLNLPTGKYKLTTPDGVDFNGHHYTWSEDVNVQRQDVSFDLSNDNATITTSTSIQPTRKVDDLTTMFEKYQNAVVTVWSEIGSGTGSIVDRAGLIMTNQHIVGPSQI